MPGSCWMSQSIIPSNKSYHGHTQHVFMVLLRDEKALPLKIQCLALKTPYDDWNDAMFGLIPVVQTVVIKWWFLRPNMEFSVVTLFSSLNKTIKNMLSETMIWFIAWNYGLGHPATTWYGVQQWLSPNSYSHGGQKWVLLIRPKSYLMRL